MDYTKVTRGWIYCITNKINGKMYIGQTMNFNKRKYYHFHYERCYRLSQAIKKYGKDNFDMQPLFFFDAINKEICADVLNKLEILFIKKYDTFNAGYNCTAGGSGQLSRIPSEETRKKIGRKSKEWGEKQENFYSKIATKKPVLQYDLNGRFYREYSSITEASKQFPSPRAALTLISEHIKGKHQSAEGFIWKLKEEENFPLFIDGYKEQERLPVYYYAVDGILIASYKSVREASEMTGANIKTIKTSLRSDKLGRARKGNFWSRQAPPPKRPL